MSLLRLQFREASVADLLQVHDYLQEQATSALADRFLMAVERTMERIRRYPAAGSFFRPRLISLAGLRWWPIAEFPRYLIYCRSNTASSTSYASSTALAMRKGN